MQINPILFKSDMFYSVKIIAILTVILLFNNKRSNGQTHIIRYNSPVYECNLLGDIEDTSIRLPNSTTTPPILGKGFKIAETGYLLDSIALIAINGKDYILIQFLNWQIPDNKKDSAYISKQLYKINTFNYAIQGQNFAEKIQDAKEKKEDSVRKYFLVSADIFSSRIIKYEKWKNVIVNAGALYIPFKIRTSPFDFSKDITLSSTISCSYKCNSKLTAGITFGAGISSILVDSFYTEGKQKESSNLSAFTLTSGVLLTYGKVQLGINAGWDFLGASDKSKNWMYNQKRWYGIGIGFNIFTPQDVKKEVKEEKQGVTKP